MSDTRHPHALAAAILAGAVVVAGVLMAKSMADARLPGSASGRMLVVFPLAMSGDDMFARIIRAGARPIRQTWLDAVWVVAGDRPGLAGRLIANGAAATYGDVFFAPQLAGCFAYVDSKARKLFAIRP